MNTISEVPAVPAPQYPEFPYTPEQLQWLADLDSGKYQQGKFCLQQDNKFCCLGVAMDSLGIKPVRFTGNYNSDFEAAAVFEFPAENGDTATEASGSLTPEAIRRLQMNSGAGALYPQIAVPRHLKKDPIALTCFKSLVELNDEYEYTHKQIADFIRKYPTSVFTNLNTDTDEVL